LLFLGAGLAAKWGRLDFVTPTPALHASFAEQAKRALWFLDIGLIGGVVVGGVVVVAMLAGAALSTQPTVRRVWSDPRLMLSGRILLAVAGLASLPAFTTSIADIL
jgi:hypothetical protein